jgi:hypothetical protein
MSLNISSLRRLDHNDTQVNPAEGTVDAVPAILRVML